MELSIIFFFNEGFPNGLFQSLLEYGKHFNRAFDYIKLNFTIAEVSKFSVLSYMKSIRKMTV